MAQRFQILWFEDQLDEIASQRAELEEQAHEDHGIELIFEDRNVASDDIIEDVKRRQKLHHDFDLVVMDYDLGVGATGDVVAARIRKSFGFVPMIFYSGSLGGVSRLRQQLSKADVDGVHCVTRGDLVNFLADQLDELFHPLSRIETVRGSAVGVLAKCDDKIREWFSKSVRGLSEADKVAIEQKLEENLRESSKRRSSQWGRKNGDLAWKTQKLESYQLMRISHTLAKTLEQNGLPKVEDFQKDVLAPRNTLGHATEERAVHGTIVRASDGSEIGQAQLADLRTRMATIGRAIYKFADEN